MSVSETTPFTTAEALALSSIVNEALLEYLGPEDVAGGGIADMTTRDLDGLHALVAPRVAAAEALAHRPISARLLRDMMGKALGDVKAALAIRFKLRDLTNSIAEREEWFHKLDDSAIDVDPVGVYEKMRELTEWWEEVLRLNETFPPSVRDTAKGLYVETTPEVREYVALLRGRVDVAAADILQWRQTQREFARHIRITVARAIRADEDARAAAHQGTVCSSCGKKPARVDTLCKRCAYAAGTLPHGKIGEG